MRFFTQKVTQSSAATHNRAVLAQASQSLNASQQPKNYAPQQASVGVGKLENEQAPSNQRFRSFAERYIIERCRDWKESEVDARAWEAILQAKSIYNKVKEVGRTLTNAL